VDARTAIKEPDNTEVGPGYPNVPPERRWIKVSPINRRRWENFKVNRRGYWSLWIFLALFLVSLFAEFIANDKPIYIHVNGRSYFPAVVTYADTDFARQPDPLMFGTAADYRDPYLMDLIKDQGGTVIWPPIRYSYDTQVSHPPPSRHGC
jgi:microcin C transport system permease protein